MNAQNKKLLSQADADRSIRRIKSLLLEDCYSYQEMVEILNRENYKTIRGAAWTRTNLAVVIFRIRHEESSWYALSSRRANFRPAQVAA